MALAAGLALFVVQLDLSVLLIVLPTIAHDLHLSPVVLASFATGSFLVQTALLPASGWICDRFGGRDVMLGAIIAFVAFSIATTMANGYWSLLILRLAVAASAALVAPVARTIVVARADPAQLLRVVNYLTMPMLAAPAVGPLFGAILVVSFGWHAVFWGSAAAGLVALLMAAFFIPGQRSPVSLPFAWRRFLCVSAGLTFSLWGFDRALAGPAVAVHIMGAVLMVAGMWMLITAWRAEPRTAAQVNDSQSFLARPCFKYPTFAAMVGGGGFLARIPLRALPLLVPLHLQMGLGLSLAQTGVAIAALSIGDLLARPLVKPVIHSLGARGGLIMIGICTSIILVGLALPGPGTSISLIFGFLAFAGAARAVLFLLMSVMMLADLPREYIVVATNGWNIFQQASNAAATSVCAVLLTVMKTQAGFGDLSAGRTTFLMLAALSFLAIPWFARLPRDAGAGLKGPAPAV